MKKISLLFFAAFALLQMKAQSDILERFLVIESANALQIDFAIIGGASCNGVDLERSTDGFETLEIVDVEPGVCGGSDRTEFYSLFDRNPLARTPVQYRLRLGSVGYSAPQDYNFIPLEKSWFAYPQPAQDIVSVKFNNSEKLEHSLVLINSQGLTIATYGPIKQSAFSIDVREVPAGSYYFKITKSGVSITQGRIIVVH